MSINQLNYIIMSTSLLTPLNRTLKDSKTWAKNWQDANPKHAKAFFIPTLEIMACMEEMGVLIDDGNGKYTVTSGMNNAGIRVYMAIDPSGGTDKKNGYGEKLLIVGTTKDKNGDIIDIIEGRTNNVEGEECNKLLSGLIGSGIFDFTDPCPSNCDPGSPLVNP